MDSSFGNRHRPRDATGGQSIGEIPGNRGQTGTAEPQPPERRHCHGEPRNRCTGETPREPIEEPETDRVNRTDAAREVARGRGARSRPSPGVARRGFGVARRIVRPGCTTGRLFSRYTVDCEASHIMRDGLQAAARGYHSDLSYRLGGVCTPVPRPRFQHISLGRFVYAGGVLGRLWGHLVYAEVMSVSRFAYARMCWWRRRRRTC